MDKKQLFEKGFLALKPFLLALQEGAHDKLFDTQLGGRLQQFNREKKNMPSIVVGLIGSVLSVLQSKNFFVNYLKDLSTDSTALFMRRLRKSDLPEETIQQVEVFTIVENGALKSLFEWAAAADDNARQQFFAVLGSMSSEQINKLLSLEPGTRRNLWEIIEPTEIKKKKLVSLETRKKIDDFFRQLHIAVEQFNRGLAERIKRKNKRNKRRR